MRAGSPITWLRDRVPSKARSAPLAVSLGAVLVVVLLPGSFNPASSDDGGDLERTPVTVAPFERTGGSTTTSTAAVPSPATVRPVAPTTSSAPISTAPQPPPTVVPSTIQTPDVAPPTSADTGAGAVEEAASSPESGGFAVTTDVAPLPAPPITDATASMVTAAPPPAVVATSAAPVVAQSQPPVAPVVAAAVAGAGADKRGKSEDKKDKDDKTRTTRTTRRTRTRTTRTTRTTRGTRRTTRTTRTPRRRRPRGRRTRTSDERATVGAEVFSSAVESSLAYGGVAYEMVAGGAAPCVAAPALRRRLCVQGCRGSVLA